MRAKPFAALAVRCWLGLVVYGLVGWCGEQLALALSLPLAPSAIAAASEGAALHALRPGAGSTLAAPQLHHCAVATQRTPALEAFERDVAALGGELQVLGQGDPLAAAAKRSGRPFPWGLRLAHALERARALPPTDLLLMSDAFDIVTVASPGELLGGYWSAVRAAHAREPEDPALLQPQYQPHQQPVTPLPPLRAPRAVSIVIGAEASCWPDAGARSDYPPVDLAAEAEGGHAFVNGGCWMGEARSIAAVLSAGGAGAPPWAAADPGLDDQRWLRQAYLASRANASLPRMALDHGSRLCLNMEGASLRRDLAWDAGARRWRNRATGAAPLLLHFNGDKTEFRGELARRFVSGRVCFAEHAAWCSAWGLGVGVGAALAGGAAALGCSSERAAGALEAAAAAALKALRAVLRLPVEPQQEERLLPSAPGTATPCPEGAPATPAPPRWCSAAAAAHLARLAACGAVCGPLLLLVVLVLACPLCSRPASTRVEAASSLLWPPADFALGRGGVAAALVVCCGAGAQVAEALGARLGGCAGRGRDTAARLAAAAALVALAGGPLLWLASSVNTGGGCSATVGIVALAGASANHWLFWDGGGSEGDKAGTSQ